MSWATWEAWAAIKKYNLSVYENHVTFVCLFVCLCVNLFALAGCLFHLKIIGFAFMLEFHVQKISGSIVVHEI